MDETRIVQWAPQIGLSFASARTVSHFHTECLRSQQDLQLAGADKLAGVQTALLYLHTPLKISVLAALDTASLVPRPHPLTRKRVW